MRAVVFEEYGAPPVVREVTDPSPAVHGVVVRVEATGLCRSDWHAWAGHDRTIALPHVPGHELAGVVEEVGADVSRWRAGDRVTVPFVCACGTCEQCLTGNQEADLATVTADVIGTTEGDVRGAALETRWQVSNQTLLRLRRDGDITGRIAGHTLWLERGSLVAFLERRRA